VSRRSAALGSAQAPAREPSPLIAAPLAAPHCRTTDPPPLWTATLKKPRDVLASTQKKYPTEIASIRHACVQTTFSRSQLQHPLWRVAEPPSHARVLLHNRKGFGSTVSVSPLGFPTPPPRVEPRPWAVTGVVVRGETVRSPAAADEKLSPTSRAHDSAPRRPWGPTMGGEGEGLRFRLQSGPCVKVEPPPPPLFHGLEWHYLRQRFEKGEGWGGDCLNRFWVCENLCGGGGILVNFLLATRGEVR